MAERKPIRYTVVVDGVATLRTTDRVKADAEIDKALKAKKKDIRLTWPRGPR